MIDGSSEHRHRALLITVTSLVPVLGLAALELGLRVVGFGGSHPLFVDVPGLPGARYANPDLLHRYVASTGKPIATIDPFPFQAEKPEDGYRIVVQGGSTAAGFPYGRWGGLAGMLGNRLEAAFPDRDVEVVTTAMAAVNSYTLADLVDEIIEIDPDSVLVYAGHNEFLGILGVGSALSGATSRTTARLHLRLRSLRLYQLIQQAVAYARELGTVASGADRNTLFALAASGSSIPYGSEQYEAGLAQFEANIGELLRKYRKAGIPVYIGTLVSNEKDLSPFVGGPGGHVDGELWARLSRAQQSHRLAGDTDAARDVLEEMLELDENAADAWYALGQVEWAAGRFEAARAAFVAAKDLDALRLRAPEALNELIWDLGERFGATVVDVHRRFAEASPEGVLGEELLLEHVHPNAEGYFLLADAFYEAIRRDGHIGDWSAAPDIDEARRDIPLTEVDLIRARYYTREMRAGFPFSDPPRPFEHPPPRSEVERLALELHTGKLEWIHAMEALLQRYRREGRIEDAARVARLAAQEYPTDRKPNFAAGALLAELGKHRRARRYLERSLRAEPRDPATLAALVRVSLALDDAARAREYLKALERVAPAHPSLRPDSPGARP